MSNVAMYEELEAGINVMLMGEEADTDNASPEMKEMLAIASELRRMPQHIFRVRLATELDWQAAGRPISTRKSSAVIDEASAMPTLFGKHSGMFPLQGRSMVASGTLHAVMILLMFVSFFAIKTAKILPLPANNFTDLTAYESHPGVTAPHGGGGGGDVSKMQASKGTAPRFADEQLAPPVVELPNQAAKLKVDPTLVGPEMNLPKSAQTGDPLSKLMIASNGLGVGGGIGSGDGGGIGSGRGNGLGPGYGDGFGGGAFRVGNGVTTPRAIFAPEPEYSDEARKARFQGMVTVLAIIGTDGKPREMTVARSLGMGLDEKALAAVKIWRFQPGMKNGHPVPVQISIEVNFHLY